MKWYQVQKKAVLTSEFYRSTINFLSECRRWRGQNGPPLRILSVAFLAKSPKLKQQIKRQLKQKESQLSSRKKIFPQTYILWTSKIYIASQEVKAGRVKKLGSAKKRLFLTPLVKRMPQQAKDCFTAWYIFGPFERVRAVVFALQPKIAHSPTKGVREDRWEGERRQSRTDSALGAFVKRL